MSFGKKVSVVSLVIQIITCLYLGRLNNNLGYALDNGLPCVDVFGSELMLRVIWIILILNFVGIVANIYYILNKN